MSKGRPSDKLVDLMFMLRAGKEVKVIDDQVLVDKINDRRVLYFWANRAMTESYAMLDNGTIMPFELSFWDILNLQFEEHVVPKPVKYTLAELESIVGHKIEIVKQEG